MTAESFIKTLEGKVRFFLISFCSFTFLYSVLKLNVLEKLLPNVSMNTYIYVIIGCLSLVIGFYIKTEIAEFFQKDWEWKPKNKIEVIQNEIICFIGVGALYYFSQLGAMVLFFPKFETFQIYGITLYDIIFAVNSIIVYCIYRLTIIKF